MPPSLPPVPLARRDLLEGYATFSVRHTVAFQEVDASGFVSLPQVVEYFHEVFSEYLSVLGHPLPNVLAGWSWTAPVTGARATLLGPLKFGDRIAISLVGGRVTFGKAVHGYRIDALESGEARAIGQTTRVFLRPGTRERILLPPDLERAFSELGRASEGL